MSDMVVVVETAPAQIVEVVSPGPRGPRGEKGDIGDVNPLSIQAVEDAQDAATAAAASASAAAADRTQTGLYRTATAADRVQTGSDKATATAQAGIATTKASESANSASSAATSATASSQSAADALTSKNQAATSASQAATSATNADNNATSSASSASTAQAHAATASSSATAASGSATASALSKTGAEAAKTGAETAAAQAATSAISASSSASSASESASSALTSAGTATTKASEAVTSATAAASSATTAGSNASTATTKAGEAATSATSASSSATEAASSATAAAGSATTASTKAGEAATSATNAAASQTAAAGSATSAANSATTSTTKAEEAASSAASAAAAKVAAESARDQTLSAFDSFDDRYLGSKASDPTTDNDGNAVVAGALYYCTATGSEGMRVYTGTAWVAAYVSGTGTLSAANNLSDLASAALARANLGLSDVAATGSYTDLLDKPSLFSGSYTDLTNKPSIPAVPTNVSSFTNDAGYLTSFTEADPVFNASPAKDITTTNISNWNTAYGWGNHASAGYLTSAAAATAYQPKDADLTAIAGLAGASGILKKTAADTWTLDTSAYLTGNQSITVSGDATGSGTTAIALTLANSGVTAGTYNNSATAVTPITFDAKGRATATGAAVTITPAWGSITGKPTTLSGYGITDAATSTHGHTGTYQPLDGDLTAIAGLAGTSGLLKKTAADTWTLDTNTYLTGITSGQVTTALGYTPYNSTNPNGYTSNTGTVTGVTATSPVVSSGGTAPVISMAAATASVNGYMTSTYAAKLDGIAAGANNYFLPTRLGETALQISDWNTATTNGWYMAQNGTNAPEASIWFIGHVENHGALGWCTQTVHGFTNDSSSDTKSYRREQNNGEWGAWYRLRLSEEEQQALFATKTGTNASGTWGISITGNAATATNADTLDGQHGSYYQPASTAITTSNIGSQSVNYAASAGAVPWSGVSSKPTTLSGYGITDGLTSSAAASTYAALSGATFTGAVGLSDQQLTRAVLTDCAYNYFDSGTTNALNFVNGSHQRWAPSTGAQTLSITNWPPSGELGELLIEGVNLGAATITWPTINWIKADGTTTTTFSSNGVTLQASGTDWVFLWTRDAGTTIYGKVVR